MSGTERADDNGRRPRPWKEEVPPDAVMRTGVVYANNDRPHLPLLARGRVRALLERRDEG